jgi:hypothetical protein
MKTSRHRPTATHGMENGGRYLTGAETDDAGSVPSDLLGRRRDCRAFCSG